MKNLENLKYDYNSDIKTRQIGEVTMAYNPENSDMYEFNDVGGEILELLKQGVEINELFAILCKNYSVKKEEIYEDVYEIITRLLELGVIREKCEESKLKKEALLKKCIFRNSPLKYIEIQIDDNIDLIKDLGYDSLSFISLIVDLEETFNYKFDRNALSIDNFKYAYFFEKLCN